MKKKVKIVFSLITFLSFLSIFILPLFFELNIIDQAPTKIFLGPSLQFWMGTDYLGRNLFYRIIYAVRISLILGLITAITSLAFGSIYGITSAYIGGRIDKILQRMLELFISIPAILIIIIALMLFKNSTLGIIIAISIISWINTAKFTRIETIKIKKEEYILSARSLGASHLRIIFKYIIPQLIPLYIVLLTLQIPSNILYESFISFIGLGLKPPLTSLGTLSHDGFEYMTHYPYLIIFPGITLFIITIFFNQIGLFLSKKYDIKQ